MEDDDEFSDHDLNYIIAQVYQRLEATTERIDNFRMSDSSSIDSDNQSEILYDGDNYEFDYSDRDYDSDDDDDDDIDAFDDGDDDISAEEDSMSEASTVVNEGHHQPSQSGTDTEAEVDQVAEDEPIVQTQKKIKLDEPEEAVVEDIANESCDEDQKCPICLETWSNAGEHRLCSLRCGHLFGLKCITQWFNVAKNAAARKCPECNSKASKRDIRILYAKKLVCIDTSEIEKLKEQLKEACTKKETIEREVKDFKSKEIIYKQEISNLKLKIHDLQKTVKSLTTERNEFSVLSNNLILKKNKVFDICNNGACRVMAYNPWHKILVVSSGNVVNKIDMNSLYASLNHVIHNGAIRDMAFQEQHPNILLSVGFDKKVILTDIRNNLLIHSYQLETNLWSSCWSNYSNQTFFVGGARGNITEFDIRLLQSAVSLKENPEDRSPVVSLASVPRSSSVLRAGGILACQLNSCYAHCFKEGNYVCNRIDFEGPFTSLRYNEKDHHVLLSCRANSKNPFVRHVVCTMERKGDQIQFNMVHSFNAGSTQKLLSRPCYINLQSDTMILANNESLNSIVSWSMSTGQEAFSLPISEPVVDLCSFENNTVYQAILTSKKLHLYQHLDKKI